MRSSPFLASLLAAAAVMPLTTVPSSARVVRHANAEPQTPPAPRGLQMVQALPGTTLADKLADAVRRLGSSPRDLDALITAGDLSFDLGDATAAAAFYKRAEAVDPSNARVKAGIARILVNGEQPGEALRYFDQAARGGLNPADYAADRGLAYDLIGEQERAQRDYRLALRSTVDSGDADETRRRYALSLGISGKRDQALTEIDALLRKSDRGAWRARAFILAMSGDIPAAERIANSMMPPGMATGLAPFFARLPQLGAVDRAFAVHFGEVVATPARVVDARQVPPLPALGPDPYAPVQVAAAAAPAERKRDDKRRSSRRGRDQTQVAAKVRGSKAATFTAIYTPLEPTPPSAAPGAPATKVAASAPPPVPQTASVPASATAAALLPPVPSAASIAPPPALAAASVPRVPAVTRTVASSPPPAATAATVSAPIDVAAAASSNAVSGPVPAATPVRTAAATPAPVASSAASTSPAATIPVAPPVTAPIVADAVAATPAPGATPGAATVSTTTAASPATAPTPPRMSEDSILARIIAGISVPGTELGVAAPQPPASAAAGDGAPRSPSLEDAAAVAERNAAADAAKAREAERRLAARRAAEAKALADAKALAAKKADDEKASTRKRGKEVAADDGAEGKRGKATADQKAPEKKSSTKAEKHASRVWVQVAGGANEADLQRAWKDTQAKASALSGRKGYSTPLRATNRVVTGPFDSEDEAQALVNKLATQGVSAFTFTSADGQKVSPLGAPAAEKHDDEKSSAKKNTAKAPPKTTGKKASKK